MGWRVEYIQEALDDFRSLDHSQQIPVLKAIKKVSENPLPQSEGGYGKPLGARGGVSLSGLLKIKLRGLGLRVVYRLKREGSSMQIIVISVRDDNAVYKLAESRK